MTNINPKTEQAIFNAYLKLSKKSFTGFIGGLIVPSSLGPMAFSDCMADHQKECFDAIAPNLESLQRGELPEQRRIWIERTKKGSKDSDVAAMIMWLLAFPTRPIFLQVGAADKDQASIIRKRIEDYLYYNPWLTDFIEVAAYKLRSKDGLATLDIVAADISGSHGATPDFLVCNELSHVTKWEFIENLLDNADGVPRGMVVIATNAGYKGTPAENLKNLAEDSPAWSCFYLRKPAPWISHQDLEDAKRRNSDSRFRRLWHGAWVSGKGDAFDEELIDRCIDYRRGPTFKPEKGWFYVAGLDLGISHDHAGLVVLGVNPTYPKIRMAWMRAFQPNRTGEVSLMDVEEHSLAVYRTYKLTWFGYDPYQAKLMAQRLRVKGVPMREVPFTGNRLNVMASTLMEVLREGKLEAYDDEDGRLRKDFGRFTILEKSYGYKLESTRDASGHADVGTALALALPQAVAILDGRMLMPEDDLIFDDGDDLSPIEVSEMPEELRDIYKHDYSTDYDVGY